MPQINLPFNIQNDDDLDAGPVMGNYESITSVVNGSLEMGANVLSATPPAPITGKSSLPGVSTAGLRSDAQFTLQGVQNATDVPASGNFLGRLVYITAGTGIGKLFMCTSTAGTGTWLAVGNLAAADLVAHAAEHKVGGHDPLADNTITAAMRASQAEMTATMSADFSNLAHGATNWSDLGCDLAVTTTGVQTVMVAFRFTIHNNSSDSPGDADVVFRFRDVTASPAVTVYRSPTRYRVSNTEEGDTPIVSDTFFYTVPATGARTLRAQAACTNSLTNVNIVAPVATLQDDALVQPNVEAVIL